MALSIIRLGDKTTHGGVVISASSIHLIHGLGIARVGDMVTCPMPGHGINPIIEGSPTFTIDGRQVALHGHHSACGCALISSIPTASQG
ncbi:PAAR domain-containing protein [Collimonas fungivorans]|uniref:PAAR domain-containing protein n=1 Tax=Collimonas fungivorans TaxID=158899 RepID=UPI0009ED24C3|nr:PAAR domain-containing protein [Collimonas fungivorans]